MRYLSPEHYVEYFKEWFGPINMAFQRLGDGPEADAFATDLAGVWRDASRHDSAMIADCEYLEVVAVRA
jgi:hypothetical protein